jgi:hypothetical protein
MTQPTAEDRMGRLAKACAIAFLTGHAFLFLAACVGLYGFLSKPVKRVPFEQRGSAVERHAMRPAAPVERLKL